MFVLLEHQTDSDVHWDLMIELPGRRKLATWRLAENPIACQSAAIAAEPIGDHRRAYLEHEGDIGRGRGSVTRVDRGEVRMIHRDAERLVVELCGRSLRGTYQFASSRNESVELTRLEPGAGDV